MAIQLKNTDDVGMSGIKILVYGAAGSGKTSLIPGLPRPIILSAESGLLSIAGSGIPFIEISSQADLQEAYEWLISPDGDQFETIALDSISEIAEVILVNEKTISKDPRNAYGAMQETMSSVIRTFRDMNGKNILMTAKLEKTQDEMGHLLYAPAMPGNKTGASLPYFFDEVFALRVEKSADGGTDRMIMTDSDGAWLAKDRSGKLNMWEAPDLGAIIRKIGGDIV